MSTEVGVYELCDYLDMLTVLDGQSYVYFSSSRSQIIELVDWVTTSTLTENPFVEAERKEVSATTNHNSHYTDILISSRRFAK